MEVSGDWIKRNVRALYGPFDVDDLEQYADLDKKYRTTLTNKGVNNVEACRYSKKFTIVIEGNVVDALGYTEETELEKLEKLTK